MGRAQSGTQSHLRLLRVLRDEAMIEKARDIAVALVESDPTLAKMPELAREVDELRREEAASYLDKG